jgi:HSP90 family molecular chaperone
MREDITPDKHKAKALFKMAEELLERTTYIPIEKFPSPTLCDLYDVIHMLIEGLFSMKGIKFRGDGAHIETIDEAKNQGYILESERVFIQQIRSMRNRHKYEDFLFLRTLF